MPKDDTKTDDDKKKAEAEAEAKKKAAAGSGDGSGNGEPKEIDVESIVKQAVDAATEAANTTADKRINQILERLEPASKKEPEKKDDDPAAAAIAKVEERLSKTQRRLLTAAVRDEVKRLDPSVQSVAREMAKSVTDRMTITDDMDEDETAVEVVALIESQLDSAKETFETELRDDLKSRGLLKDEDKGNGSQGPKGGDDGSSDEDAKKQYEAGAAAAKERFKTKE